MSTGNGPFHVYVAKRVSVHTTVPGLPRNYTLSEKIGRQKLNIPPDILGPIYF